MAVGGLLALLDDITAILDDVAAMTKVAAAKAAGITGDDLAVNTQQLVGIDPSRELPIVWRVAKGSLRNKFILVPSALFLSAFAEWSIIPLLMVGAAYLCYEAAEKTWHAFRRDTPEEKKHHKKMAKAAAAGAEDLVALEEQKIADAIKTDFILSAEIVVVALGTVREETLAVQAAVLIAVGIGMTAAVYGLVAGIVKLDDLGMHLAKKRRKRVQAFGRGLVNFAPRLMKILSVLGTLAMYLVGGGIILHGIPAVKAAMHGFPAIAGLLAETAFGIALGFLLIPLTHGTRKLFAKPAQAVKTTAAKAQKPGKQKKKKR